MNETPNLKINTSPLVMPSFASANLDKSGGEKEVTQSEVIKKQELSLEKKLIAGEQKQDSFEKRKDPLERYPVRLCAYSNEVGAAISPIPVIGPTLFMLSWIPALMYFGADIYDKYARGKEGNYSDHSKSKALEQTVFQGLASVILPTAAVLFGQNVASRITRFTSKDKMDIRVKEDIISELKRDINHGRIKEYGNQICDVLSRNKELNSDEILNLDEIKQIKNNFSQRVMKDIETECETLERVKQHEGIFKKIIDFVLHVHKDCAHVSDAGPEKLHTDVKSFLQRQSDSLVNMRILMQRALNSDGIFNEYAKDLDPKLLKKAKKILEKNISNRDIKNKTSFVIRECTLNHLNSIAMRLSLFKIIGGFTSLALLAAPIDHFVEHYIIEKVIEPQLNKRVAK